MARDRGDHFSTGFSEVREEILQFRKEKILRRASENPVEGEPRVGAASTYAREPNARVVAANRATAGEQKRAPPEDHYSNTEVIAESSSGAAPPGSFFKHSLGDRRSIEYTPIEARSI